MVDDVDEGLFSQAPLADGFMAVLEGGERRHAVVQVDGVQAFQAQHGVELFQHGVQAVDDVVPGGIKRGRCPGRRPAFLSGPRAQ